MVLKNGNGRDELPPPVEVTVVKGAAGVLAGAIASSDIS
jgi:hypothetical protein